MGIELADNVWVIFAAYVAAFLPWAVISSSFDFISPVWKTVSDTWTEGVLVIFYTSIPAVYIIFYIVLQAQVQDFREMFAAIVALLFSLLHICSALWGLWKLHVFRYWAAHSIVNLGKLGIVYKTERDSKTLQNALNVADELFVNDTIIDNKLCGSCPCYLKYGSKVFQLSSNRMHSFVRHLFVLPAQLLLPFHLLFYILKDLASGNYRLELHLVPERPVEVWLNWAVAFASQGLESWIRGFAVAQNPDELDTKSSLSNAELFQQRQRYFAGEVLASAALHFWPREGECSTLSPMVWSVWAEGSDVYDGKVSKQELLRLAVQTGKGLPFSAGHEAPTETNQRHLEGYVRSYGYAAFSRQLRRTVHSAPAGFGDWIETFDIEKLEWLAIMLNLGAYASEVETESDSLRKGYNSASGSEEVSDSPVCQYSRDRDNLDPEVGDDDETVEQLDCRDLAVENLLKQLGFEKDHIQGTKQTSIRSLCAFPLPGSCLNRVARCNRLVMRAGEMIDIWCALEAGRQLLFLKEFGEPWDLYCHGYKDMHGDDSFDHNNEDEDGRSNEIFGLGQSSLHGTRITSLKECERLMEAQRRVETMRGQFQLGEEKPRYWHMEQTVTFMGYGMEFVRTELAAWTKGNESSDATAWKAMFGNDTENDMCTSEEVNLGVISDMMIGVVRSKGIRHLKNRSVQIRIIWEIQRRLEAAYKRSSCGPGSVELMMLCLLSFPSFIVTIEEDCRSSVESITQTSRGCAIMLNECWGGREGDVESDCSYQIVIKPQCAPQHIDVVANLKVYTDLRMKISAHMRGPCEDGQVFFMWEWWRDAFLARLESATRWQRDHEYMTSGEIGKTEDSIASGVKGAPTDSAMCPKPYYTWTGWLPFRKSICRFELETPEFLWQHKEHGGKVLQFLFAKSGELATFSIATKEYCCVAYEDVHRQQLRHFNFVVREVDLNYSGHDEQCKNSGEGLIVDKALDLLSKGSEHFPRAMFLLETAVAEKRNINALEKYVDELIKDGETQDIERAIQVVANYLSTILPHNLRQLSDEEQNQIRRIRGLYTKIVRRDGYSETSTTDFSGLSFVTCAIKMENTFDALRVLETMLFRSRSLKLLWPYSGIVLLGNETSATKVHNEASRGSFGELFDTGNNASSIALYHFMSKCFWRGIQQEGILVFKNALALHLEGGTNGVPGDPARAKELYEEAIKEGRDVYAMCNLASLLESGATGVEVDAVRAKELYEEAIKEERLAGAMCSLGSLLEEGAEGVSIDAVRAKALYEEAIKQGGNADAICKLAWLLENGADGVDANAVRAKELYEDAIREARHVDSMNNLALMLKNGAEGVDKDAVRAKALYEDAIKEGRNVYAMYNLAVLLENGAEGVEVDAVRAKELYEDAVREGHDVDAMNNLAELLENGADGVSVDAVMAKELYEEAIKEGRDIKAMYNLASMLENGAEGVSVDAVRAKALYEDAIKEGRNVYAMCNLAELLETGAEGVCADAARAKTLYEDAIREGRDTEAMERLARLLERGAEGVQRDERRASALRLQAQNGMERSSLREKNSS